MNIDTTTREDLQALQDGVNDMKRKLYRDVQQRISEHWEFVNEMQMLKKGREDRSCMTPRVRVKNNTLTITWNRFTHFDKESRRRYSAEITKPRGQLKYSTPKLAKYAKDWEIEEILALENVFEDARKQIRKCSEIMRAIKTYARMQNIDLDESPFHVDTTDDTQEENAA